MKHYELDCIFENLEDCHEHGLFLFRIIRCCKSKSSLNYNCYHDAWFLYTLKLTRYFDNKPVSNDPSLTQYIADDINPETKQVQHPRQGEPPTEDIETVKDYTKFIHNIK